MKKKKLTAPKNEPTLKVGWWVALTLKPDTAPLRCYVGQIQAFDDAGVRITLVDWFTGMPASWDFYVPRDNIVSALMATEQHDLRGFGPAAGKWQEQMNGGARKEPEQD